VPNCWVCNSPLPPARRTGRPRRYCSQRCRQARYEGRGGRKNALRIIHGDCLAFLPTLPDKSIHCCISSPPYFNMRDYQTGEWVGGDPACEHVSDGRYYTMRDASAASGEAFAKAGEQNATRVKKARWRERRHCQCGAEWSDHQIGLESSPEEYVAKLVKVFREVRRVLRDDGTVWLNIGDSYASAPPGNRAGSAKRASGLSNSAEYLELRNDNQRQQRGYGHCKPKDLIGIPWRVAFALQADGWYLRSAIIWAKPSVMPESVKDRPTNCYEHVFLLAKSERNFYDAVAIAEPSARAGPSHFGAHNDRRERRNPGRDRYPSKWHRDTSPDQQENVASIDETRNCRNLWTIATKPFSGAHYAVMPLELAERCVLAGTSERGCCAACGAPWRRVTEHTDEVDTSYKGNFLNAGKTAEYQGNRSQQAPRYRRQTVGWQPSCQCKADVVPCTVLDMFGGVGTTAHAALKHGRDAILIELNSDYIRLAEQRLAGYLHPAIKLAAD
jgi:DNA modification methylase